MSEKSLKLIPYGISDYTVVRSGNYIYIDKTKYIEFLESKFLYTFIVRPRRFGKTLFTGMLKKYYDIAAGNEFEKNFSGTYIGENKTPLANSFRVLHLNFSGLASDNIADSINESLKSSFELFLNNYPDDNCEKILEKDYTDPSILLNKFLKAIYKKYGKTLYVIIDEYDQFANEILSQDFERFKKITSSGGILKNFYAKLKEATETDGAVARIFITGVTKISLDSMTSGFNIASDITNDPQFAAIFGFTEDEVRQIIPQAVDLRNYGESAETVLERMKNLYDGYMFSQESGIHVFNSSMSLYYLFSITRTDSEPKNLLDPSFSQDISKIHGILSLGDKTEVERIIDKLISCNSILLTTQIPYCININSSNDTLQTEDILLIMINFGYLTISNSDDYLSIPNIVIYKQFFEYYIKYIRGLKFVNLTLKDKNAIIQLKNGDPRPFIETVCNRLDEVCGINHFLHMRENDICSILGASAIDLPEYRPFLGAEVTGVEKGYADLVLKPVQPDGISYLFEFKFLAKKNGTDACVAAKLAEAQCQLGKYRTGKNMEALPNLKCVACVFVGLKLAGYSIS